MKIYIIGHRNINTLPIGLLLQSANDSLSVSPSFTTNPDKVDEYTYYLDKETVNISYKNNSIITIITDNNESYGITYDDYYNNNVFCMTIADFNVIPDKMFISDEDDNHDVLVVWVDSSKNVDRLDIIETEYLVERLDTINYLYFCNESNETISNIIIQYIQGDDDTKNELLNEYS
jgi:hypothetical protein